MGEKIKLKTSQQLPIYIEHAVILTYILSTFAGVTLLFLLSVFNIDNLRNLTMITIMILVPIMGFSSGWYLKFKYVSKQNDANLILRIKAQFWSAMAFFISLIVSLLLILMILIKLENILPESLPQPIISIISMCIMGISLFIANYNRKRVLRNFNNL